MPDSLEGTKLAEQQNVTLILRLVLDRKGQLVHGTVLDVLDGPVARFAGWGGLVRLLQIWLNQQRRQRTSNDS
ncbi:MAG TPA: hypothetical protein PKE45_15740 [Caldilineaceae bacterium]|nr:hypothetical protein [Caldilineaceae bacterium]